MKARGILITAALAGALVGGYGPLAKQIDENAAERRAIEQSVIYGGCHEVRAAGKAPLYAGQPGYGAHMDGDGDGVACEPYRI